MSLLGAVTVNTIGGALQRQHAAPTGRTAATVLGAALSLLGPAGGSSAVRIGLPSLVPLVAAAGGSLGCSRRTGPETDALLAAGSPAPDLSGTDQQGTTRTLRSLTGKPVVVYFYPKDATPGCTKEACAFRDVWQKYEAAGVQVLGVSRDDRESHARFASEHRLPFPLIADPGGDWARAFGVPTRLGMYARVSFLIGRDGRIAKVYPDVDPGVHAAEVLAAAQQLP